MKNVPSICQLLVLSICFGLFTVGCGSGDSGSKATTESEGDASSTTEAATESVGDALSKPGMIQASEITLGDIDAGMVEKGHTTYDVKCQACHSLESNRVVGPGWKGVTSRREPHWIMNMIVNTEAMLADDPEAQRQFEECLVRMPNQSLSKDEARQVLEFMRQNDNAK